MKNYKKLILGTMLLLLASSCSKEDNSPIEKDKTAPAPISNPIIENLPGAARITYSLPSDEDLLYVLARYVNKRGKTLDFRSSYYKNTITVEGFGDTSDYTVELYAVDRSENKSAPIAVKIQPLTPPVIATAESLTMTPDFGGVRVAFKNLSKADLAIVVCTDDAGGEITAAETFYTARDSAKFSVRGYASEPRKFGVFVRDKWGNLSDTIYKEITPIYEVMMDKSKFKALLLPTDADATSWGGALYNIWDGDTANGDKVAHTGNTTSGGPRHITFDMGVLAQLSRFNLTTTPDDKHLYNDVSPRLYEVWGCEQYDPSGSFDGWTKLVTIENIKPSGLPIGLLNEDDRIAGRKGDDADIPINMPKVRYIRIRCLNNWSGNTNMIISEVTFWGNDK